MKEDIKLIKEVIRVYKDSDEQFKSDHITTIKALERAVKALEILPKLANKVELYCWVDKVVAKGKTDLEDFTKEINKI